MIDKSNTNEGANPNYNNYYASYPKKGFDPTLAALLALSNINYATWQMIGKTDGGDVIQNNLKQYLNGTGAPGSDVGQGSMNPQDVIPWLTKLGYLTGTQANALSTGVAPTKATPAKGTVKQPGLVAQPTGLSAGGGVPGVPQAPKYTSGQLARDLKSMGYNFPFDITPFVQKAIQVSNGDSSTAMSAFLSGLYGSQQFKHYYPNYFSPSGTARFSNPGDYDKQVLGYQSMAQRQGFTVDRNLAGKLIGQDVSGDEFKQRVDMAAQIKTNKDLFTSFNQIAAQQGIKGIKTAQDAFAFLSGRADPKSYQVWNGATAQAAAKNAGVAISGKEAVSATGAATQALNYTDVEKSYQDIAQQLRDSGAELGAFGLSTRDLETVQFGGANRAMLAARASQALAQTQAQGQQVNQAMTTTASGIPVAAQQQQAGA